MAPPNNKLRLKMADEVSASAAGFNGSWQTLTTIANEPVVFEIDNDTTVDVQYSDDGGVSAHTIRAGAVKLVDSRANKGNADNYTFPVGTVISVNAAAGSGSFYFRYYYAR